MTDPVPTLTLLAKLYDDQADADPDHAAYFTGAANGLRVALQILVPMNGTGGKGKRGMGGGKAGTPPPGFSTPPPPTPADYPLPIKTRAGYRCPECDAIYKLPQHMGAHRKREHGVPSQRDIGAHG